MTKKIVVGLQATFNPDAQPKLLDSLRSLLKGCKVKVVEHLVVPMEVIPKDNDSRHEVILPWLSTIFDKSELTFTGITRWQENTLCVEARLWQTTERMKEAGIGINTSFMIPVLESRDPNERDFAQKQVQTLVVKLMEREVRPSLFTRAIKFLEG